MEVSMRFKGATEPQFKMNCYDSDSASTALNVLKRLESQGLLYAPVEEITIKMSATEYCDLC